MKGALKDTLSRLPDSPGVYLMKDERQTIIYVGKAKSLRKRVRSYFSGQSAGLKTSIMVEHVRHVEVITTHTEVEALMLESNLIKKHKPHYNIILKDDKHFPFIKLTLNEDFPRLVKTRRVVKDGAKYYGPFIPEGDANRLISLVRKLFPLRRCKGPLKQRERPCIYYEMQQCSSPCTGKISKEQYREIISQVKLFLDGKTEHLIERLMQEMMKASEELRFEEAIRLRDRIKAVRSASYRQSIISPNLDNRDIVAFASKDSLSVIEVFFVRNGRLLGRKSFTFDSFPENKPELLRAFLMQFYDSEQLIPPEILIPFSCHDQEMLVHLLRERAGRKVLLTVPQRGAKKSYLSMAQKNAKLNLEEQMQAKDSESTHSLMRAVGQLLGLEEAPQTVEMYDISNFGGAMAVGSLVVWENAGFNKQKYRRFKIKTVSGANDVQMMSEVVERHLKRIAAKGEQMPDVIVVDGAQSQVNAVVRVINDGGFRKCPVIGIAKGRSLKKNRMNNHHHRLSRPLAYDYLVTSEGRKLSSDDLPEPVLHFFMKIRDEAHRFAIEYHRKLREKRHFRSILDEIPGVGSKRKRALLRAMGSLERISNADWTELAQIRGIDSRTARTIAIFFDSLRKQDSVST